MDKSTHLLLVPSRDCYPGQANLNEADYTKLSNRRSRAYFELETENGNYAVVNGTINNNVPVGKIEVDVGVMLSLHPNRASLEAGTVEGSSSVKTGINVKVSQMVGVAMPRPLGEVTLQYPETLDFDDMGRALTCLRADADGSGLMTVTVNSYFPVKISSDQFPKLLKVQAATPYPRGIITHVTQILVDECKSMNENNLDSTVKFFLSESSESSQNAPVDLSMAENVSGDNIVSSSHTRLDRSAYISPPVIYSSAQERPISSAFDAYLLEHDDSDSEQGFVIVGANNVPADVNSITNSHASLFTTTPSSSVSTNSRSGSSIPSSSASTTNSRRMEVQAGSHPPSMSDFEFAQQLGRALVQEEEARRRRQLEEDEEMARSLAAVLEHEAEEAKGNRQIEWKEEVGSNSAANDNENSSEDSIEMERAESGEIQATTFLGLLRHSATRRIRNVLTRRRERYEQVEARHSRRSRSRVRNSNMGEGRSGGLSRREINSLPLGHARKDDSEPCAICLSSMKGSTAVRTLACLHQYHASCVDPWLEANSLCPICRTDALGRD